MDTFEFTLTVEDFDLDDEFQNAMLETFGYLAVIGRTAGITQLDIEIEAESADHAVARVIADLRGIGVTTRRVDLDLVNTTDIADRLGINRETVRLWARGERRQGFPAPHAIVGDSQVWAWADVHAWAAAAGVAIDEPSPIPVDIAEAFTGAAARTATGAALGSLDR